jgi:hypothetical protein
MGDFMAEDDAYIPSILDLMNLRFAPSEGGREPASGILELADLQQKFKIFSEYHSFRDSVALLNLAGSWHWQIRKKWYALLDNLNKCTSDQDGVNGNDRIVTALEQHVNAKRPGPVYFTSHDARVDKRVLVKTNDTPIFYIEGKKYLTISIPMRPKRRGGSKKKA